MPTLGGHFSEEEEKLIKEAAGQSREEKVGPYISAAVRARLQNEGYLPGTTKHDIRAEALAVAEVVGEEKVLELLKQARQEAHAHRAAVVE